MPEKERTKTATERTVGSHGVARPPSAPASINRARVTTPVKCTPVKCPCVGDPNMVGSGP